MNSERPPFARTICACPDCRECCKRRPGHLIPSDLPLLAAKLVAIGRIQRPEEVTTLLRKTAGARLLLRQRSTGETTLVVVPSISPARYASGRCVFLTADERCEIHEAAPFGCQFFDIHMGAAEGEGKSLWGMYRMTDPEYQALRETLPEKEVEP